jgi:hypothetical protein
VAVAGWGSRRRRSEWPDPSRSSELLLHARRPYPTQVLVLWNTSPAEPSRTFIVRPPLPLRRDAINPLRVERIGNPGRAYRRFRTRGSSPNDQPLQILCEDHVGTYVIPFPCRWPDGLWENAKTSRRIEATVVLAKLSNELSGFQLTFCLGLRLPRIRRSVPR